MRKKYASDVSREKFEEILPLLQSVRRRTKPTTVDLYEVFCAVLYLLRTGCQWKALPAERFGSASAIHKRFLEWEKAGFFEAVWKAGLAEYDDMQGIAWRWQSVDGAMMKAPLAQEAVGPNPTDRGKKGKQTPPAGGRPWRPVVARRERGQRPRLQEA